MVSIITITYNRAGLLKHTIQSVLAQTYTDFEYIIVDDGSVDDTADLVRQYNDTRIKYHPLPHSGRLDKLRNYGISEAAGKYIAFIDSDDLWLEDMLQAQVSLLDKNEELGFTFCEAEIFSAEKIVYKNIYRSKYKNGYSGFFMPLLTDVEFVIFPSTIVIRKVCLDKTGLFDEALTCGDKDLFAQLAWHYKAALVDKCLVKIRRHDANISYRSDSFTQHVLEDELITLQKFYTFGYINKVLWKQLNALFYYKLAQFCVHKKQYATARKCYGLSIRNKPLQPKTMVKYVLACCS